MDGLQASRATLAIWFHQSLRRGRQPAFKPRPFRCRPADPSLPNLAFCKAEIEQLQRRSRQKGTLALDSNQQLAALLDQRRRAQFCGTRPADGSRSPHASQSVGRRAECAVVDQLSNWISKQRMQGAAGSSSKTARKRHRHVSQEYPESLPGSWCSARSSPASSSTGNCMEAGWEADTQRLNYSQGGTPRQGQEPGDFAEWPTQNQAARRLRALRRDDAARRGRSQARKRERRRQDSRRPSAMPRGFAPVRRTSSPPGRSRGAAPAGPTRQGLPALPDSLRLLRQQPPLPASTRRAQRHLVSRRASAHRISLVHCSDFHTPRTACSTCLTRSKMPTPKPKLTGRRASPTCKLRRYQERRHRKPSRPPSPAGQNNVASLAMATGTGKTRTIIGLMYRLLKAERFRRILFLVDRTRAGRPGAGCLQRSRSWSRTSRSRRSTTSPNWATWRHRGRNPRAGGHRAGHGQAHLPVGRVDRHAPRNRRLRLHHRRRGPPWLHPRSGDDRGRDWQVRDQAQYLSTYRRVHRLFRRRAHRADRDAGQTQHRDLRQARSTPTRTAKQSRRTGSSTTNRRSASRPCSRKQGIKFEKGETGQRHQLSVPARSSRPNSTTNSISTSIAFNRRVINEDFNRVICEATRAARSTPSAKARR